MKKRPLIYLMMTLAIFAFCNIQCSNKQESPANRSQFAGVQIGAITYSFRSMPSSLQDVLDQSVAAGLGSIELMGDPVEEYAGLPADTVPAIPRDSVLAPEVKAARDTAYAQLNEARRVWRTTVGMEKFTEIKKMFNDKGINIDIVKLGSPSWTDEEIDYAFNVAKTLGARGITFEISKENAMRMAPFAEKHGLLAIMHNHGQPGEPGFSFDEMLSYGKNLALNFDIGHYIGATGDNPVNLINRLHDRIASIHIKDKTSKDNAVPNKNQEFGKGDTQIADVLNAIKDNKWPITCDIELEYDIPAGSNAVQEVKKCVDYCHAILEK